MPFLPLPFVVALLLLILFASLARRHKPVLPNLSFLALIAACALQSVLLGLRWGYGMEAARSVLPIVAATLPPLVFASFGGLARDDAAGIRAGGRQAPMWLHALPTVLVAALVLLRRDLIDFVLIAVNLGYAIALLRIARSGPDALRLVRLEGALPTYRALQIAAAVLIVSAMIDGLVALDLELMRGAHAAAVVAIANLAGLFILGLAGAVGGRSRPSSEPAEAADAGPAASTPNDSATMAAIDELMRGRKLFRDANLNLDRLARRAGLPARRISVAINRVAGKNVSQYVNGHRVEEACRMLVGTDQPVTTIMLEVGFQTKSNFNREFLRVTGESPSAYRGNHRQPGPGGVPGRVD
jgi:AraC-like DNA-binding protein